MQSSQSGLFSARACDSLVGVIGLKSAPTSTGRPVVGSTSNMYVQCGQEVKERLQARHGAIITMVVVNSPRFRSS